MNTLFLGKEVGQTLKERNVWEHLNFDRMIEIGTWRGNLSLYMLMLCIEKGKEFHTFDIEDYEPSKMKKKLGFDKHFYKKDVFKVKWLLKGLIEGKGKTVVFCDGGDKEREFNCFSRYLKKGDFIGVHDFGTEVHEENLIIGDLKEVLTTDRIKIWKK